jgi:DnaJ-class molecular chaperone
MKDYYLILGVDPGATQEQIHAAYRQQAKELHPDYYGEDCAPFREIQEAYEVLGDPGRRRKYDQQCQAEERRKESRFRAQADPSHSGWRPAGGRRSPVEPLIPRWEKPPTRSGRYRDPEPFGSSLEDILDWFWSGSPLARPATGRRHNLTVEVPLSPEAARLGGQIRVRIPVCQRCPACGGSGIGGFFVCWDCGGSGVFEGQLPLVLELPAGIVDQHVSQIQLDRFGLPNTDLTVIFTIG